MRATTQVALAVRHIGVKGSRVEAWEGTFAYCLQQFAIWVAPQYMATRFDMCMGRNEDEARKGLRIRERQSMEPQELNLENLMGLMQNATPVDEETGQ